MLTEKQQRTDKERNRVIACLEETEVLYVLLATFFFGNTSVKLAIKINDAPRWFPNPPLEHAEGASVNQSNVLSLHYRYFNGYFKIILLLELENR